MQPMMFVLKCLRWMTSLSIILINNTYNMGRSIHKFFPSMKMKNCTLSVVGLWCCGSAWVCVAEPPLWAATEFFVPREKLREAELCPGETRAPLQERQRGTAERVLVWRLIALLAHGLLLTYEWEVPSIWRAWLFRKLPGHFAPVCTI